MADWTYHKLCEAYREEKASNALAKLEPDFEDSVSLMLERLENKAAANSDASKELDSARKQALALIRLRRHKIIIRSLGAIEGNEPAGMTDKEKEVYSRVRELCANEETRVGDAIFRRKAAPRKSKDALAPQTAEQSLVKLQILKEIPAYRGADSNVYGPFKAGESALLPTSEAEWMLKGNWAENVMA